LLFPRSGASEAALDAGALAGFSAMRALATTPRADPTTSSRPFDVDRDGFVVGEGAAALVLEEREAALTRGARIYAEIRAVGATGDAHHATAPPSDGEGAARCMTEALERGGVETDDVCYVNAHATSTRAGDAAETAALASVFGARARSGGTKGGWQPLVVSSTKGATGHLLGAAGAVEAVVTVLAIHHRVAPPNLHLVSLDADSPLGCLAGVKPVSLDAGGSGRPLAALSNSFGFGGTNATLLFVTP